MSSVLTDVCGLTIGGIFMSKDTLSSYDVLNKFFDDGSFTETDAYLKSESGKAEAVTGFGTVDGIPAFAFAQDVDACGGAMSKAQAKKITKLFNAALKVGAPVVGFYDSEGGRLEQKYELLSAYGDILRKSAKLSGVVPQISVVLGNCIGTSALIAASADYVIMAEDAKLSVNTYGADDSAEVNQKNGVASFVCEDKAAAIEKAKTLLSYFPTNNLEAAPAFESVPAYDNPDKLPKVIADNDSLLCVGGGYGDDVCTAFGRVDGNPVGFVVTKGGDISADAAKKISKHVRFCDAFSIPLITLVDAKDFESIQDASALVSAYADATTAKISVITGTALGAVYIALAGSTSGADIVYALPEAIVSPIAPMAAAYILDPTIADAKFEEQHDLMMRYIKENLTAEKAAGDGYIDDIAEGAELRAKIIAALNMLSSKRVATLPKKHTTK